MVAQVIYRSCPMCESHKGAAMVWSTFQPLDFSSNQHIYSELLLDIEVDSLHTLGIHPIHDQWWYYSLCNDYRLWGPDELHQLLLRLVNDILNWLLKDLKTRNVKEDFENQFTLVPQYLSLQLFSKLFSSLTSDTLQKQRYAEWSEY